MAKLYFKYGAMGAAKSAQALVTKFNYEERGMRCWLIKPAVDTRGSIYKVASRIGIDSECEPISEHLNIVDLYKAFPASEKPGVVIADEAQFFTVEQIDQLRELVDITDTAVLCFGLRTDFRTKLFPASARLMEVADSIEEIKTMCECGKKATVNARLDPNGNIVTEGDQVEIGGNDRYQAMCHRCYAELLSQQQMMFASLGR